MTLQELLEKATPLPWERRGESQFERVLLSSGPTVVLEAWTAHQQSYGPDAATADANLLLVRHALKMLPKLMEALESILPAAHSDGDIHAQIVAVLAEANNPEVPQ